jgi:homocysteine S-methyltransferase
MRIPVVAGIWPLVSARNAEFMANEVPGVVVPQEVIQRMQRASAVSKEAGLAEGIAIAREMLGRIRGQVQGIQVSAPFGKVPFALKVFEGVPGIDPAAPEPDVSDGETFGFEPPGLRESHEAGRRERRA